MNIEIPNIQKLLAERDTARRNNAKLQEQFDSASGDLRRHGTELTRATDDVDRRYRDVADTGSLSDAEFPEEVKLKKLERQHRVLAARVAACQEKLDASQSFLDGLQSQLTGALRSFVFQEIERITASIGAAAAALQNLACEYNAYLRAFPELIHTRRDSGPGTQWKLLFGHADDTTTTEHTFVDEQGRPILGRNAPAPSADLISDRIVPDVHLQGAGNPHLLITGRGASLCVGIDNSFLAGEHWPEIGIAGALYDEFTAIRETVGRSPRRNLAADPKAATGIVPPPPSLHEKFLLDRLERSIRGK